MPTGYELLGSNKALRKHWIKRVAATLIDVAIIFAPIRLALVFLDGFNQDVLAGLAAGVVWFLYSGILEGFYGKTLGKHLLNLKVVSMTERRLLRQGFIRSVPKLFWYAFLPIDVLIGLALEGDPRRRFTDRVSLTSVVAFEPELSRIRKRSRPSEHKARNEEDAVN
jgi:uncharacterized RDD family membrane protein YckC